jgi:hypothetical protein
MMFGETAASFSQMEIAACQLRRKYHEGHRRRGWLEMIDRSPVESGPSARKSKPLEETG